MDSTVEEEAPAVVTAVRVRPMSEDERKAGCRLIVAMDGNQTIITDPAGLSSPRRSPTKATLWKQAFHYDYSYWSYDPRDASYASQQCLYRDLGTRVLEDAWKGFNSSLFAYGQTGAGKSFSMMGKTKTSNNHNVATQGLIPRICHGLFEKIDCKTMYSGTFLVKMSYVEIYNERVYDLLNRTDKDALKVREHPDKGAYVEHVSNHVVTSYHDIEYLLNEGAKTRRVAATEMNQVSSRSHAILTLSLRRELNHAQRISKICLVDLAGSERSELAQGPRLREAAYINKSLSALGEVIHTLATNVQSTNTSFVQYRNSILTRLLKDSLCGQSKLVMLAAISPCCIHYEETLSTLKYLERVKIALSTASPPVMECTPRESDAGLSSQLKQELIALRSQLRVAQQVKYVPNTLSDEDVPESVGCHHYSVPHLVNLNQDPSFTEMTFYCIEVGVTTVGKPRECDDAVPDIVLDGHDILPLHCVFHYEENGTVIIRPALGASIFLNGKDIKNIDACNIPNNSRLTFGAHHVFRFDMPHIASINDSGVDWTFAHNELLETLLPIKQAAATKFKPQVSIGLQCEFQQEPPSTPATEAVIKSTSKQAASTEVQCELLQDNKQHVILQSANAETQYDIPPIGSRSVETQCDIAPPFAMQTSLSETKEIPTAQISKRGIDVESQTNPMMMSTIATQSQVIETISLGSQAIPQITTASTQCTLDLDHRIHFSEADKLTLERKIAKLKLLLKKKDRQIKSLNEQHEMKSSEPIVQTVYDPTFDESLLQLRHNLSAKHQFPPQEITLPNQDDIVWRSSILADIETFTETTSVYDNTLDTQLLKLRHQLAALLDVVPENVELPDSEDLEWRNSVIFDICTLVDALPQTNPTLPAIAISSSEPTYKSLLDNYIAECKKVLGALTETESSHLGHYAKVIAALETRFASLCCALNVKCHHEENVFQQAYNSKVMELQKSFEDKQASYQSTTLLNGQILNRLEQQLQLQLNQLTTTHKEEHDAWTQQLQKFTKDQFEAMSRLGAEAAFHEEQARMQIAEWDTKCHRLVSETDIVLSETRAMHLKNLRRLEEKFALHVHELELKRMQEEEDCLRASEALVQKYEAIILNRTKEQEKWDAQKEEDLAQLQADHAVAMSYLASQHTDMYSQAREAREIYFMSEEDARARSILVTKAFNAALDEEMARHALELDEARKAAELQLKHHQIALGEARVGFEKQIEAMDAKAVAESVAHARFMKGINAQQKAEEDQLMATVRTSRNLLVEQRNQLIFSAKEVCEARLRKEAEHQQRLEEMKLCHANIVRDLHVAFDMQETTRREEVAARAQQYKQELDDRALELVHCQEMNAMEVEDAVAAHIRSMERVDNDWKAWVEAHAIQEADESSTHIYELQAVYTQQQEQYDNEIAALRQKCSDIERDEVEKHKLVNENHKNRLAALEQSHVEAMNRWNMEFLDVQSMTIEKFDRLEQRCKKQHEAMEEDKLKHILQLQADADERRALHTEQIAVIQQNLQNVIFTHEKSARDIEERHNRQLEQYRVALGAKEEAHMREYEDRKRRHEWAHHEVEYQTAHEHTRCLAMLTQQECIHREQLFQVQQSITALDESHRLWLKTFEVQCADEKRAIELDVEKQWNTIQLTLDEKEVEFQRHLGQLKVREDEIDKNYAEETELMLHAWTEQLTRLHMQMEDERSQVVDKMTKIQANHQVVVAAIKEDHARRQSMFENERAMAQLQHQTQRLNERHLLENQGTFYDESTIAIAQKWAVAEKEHKNKLKDKATEHSQNLEVLRIAHEAKVLELQNTLIKLTAVYTTTLDQYKIRLRNELDDLRKVCAEEEESWRHQRVQEYQQDLLSAFRDLEKLEMDKIAAHEENMARTKELWREQTTQIEMDVEDIASRHFEMCAGARESCWNSRQLIEAQHCASRQESELEIQENCMMYNAEKESVAIALWEFQGIAAQERLQREEELQNEYKSQLRKVLSWRSRKERLELGLLNELDDLQAECLHLLRSAPLCDQNHDSITVARRDLLAVKVETQLTKQRNAYQLNQHRNNVVAISKLALECKNNQDMAHEDVRVNDERIANTQKRLNPFLEENIQAPEPPAKVVPFQMDTSLEPIAMDKEKFCIVRPTPKAEELEILQSLKRNAELISAIDTERQYFRLKTDEYSNSINKLKAMVQAGEEMTASLNERARTDAETIAFLQEKVKSLVVELPTSPLASPMVISKESISSPPSDLLRGWKQ